MKKILAHYIIIALLALLLWLPLVNVGLPYFYDEDEAHHFNRQVEMLQSGDLNPKYFLKPSLNFYLRLPALYAGYIAEQTQGNLTSLAEVVTRDKYGIGSYAFTVSHLKLIQADRVFSILIGILIAWGIFYLSYLITKNRAAAFLASCSYLLSPLIFEHVTSIGVNQPAALFALLSIILATRSLDQRNFSLIIFSGIAAGLAVSCKYNAAPIVIAPVIAMHFNRDSYFRLIIIGLITGLSFLAGTPYFFLELPLVIKHISYEVWHYSTAGHIGHQGQPGLPQLMHYLQNLAWVGYGYLALAICLLSLISKKLKLLSPALLFIICFAGLMISQKANFVRNLLLIMPLVPVLLAVGLNKIQSLSKPLVMIIVAVLALLQPSYTSYQFAKEQIFTDTRSSAYQDLLLPAYQSRTAIDANLWLPKFTKKLNGEEVLNRQNISRLDFNTFSLKDLYLLGYNQILIESKKLAADPLGDKATIIKHYRGKYDYPGRVIINPDLALVEFYQDGIITSLPKITENSIKFSLNDSRECKPILTNSLWLEQKVTKLDISDCLSLNDTSSCILYDQMPKLSFTYFNPWPEQSIKLVDANIINSSSHSLKTGTADFTVDFDCNHPDLYLVVDKVLSPKEQGQSDSRNLGIKIEN